MYSNSVSISQSLIFGLAIFLLIDQMSASTTSPARLRSYRLKRSFYDDNCKGTYDKSIYAKVYQVCEDCYNMMRESKLHSLCRSECFSTQIYKGCLETLQLQNEIKQYEEWILILKGLGI